jgi:hypothetical protein
MQPNVEESLSNLLDRKDAHGIVCHRVG